MLNIHPALLPAFKGLHTHERALAAGVKIHGATVHFVVPEADSGPIVAQAAVPVVDGDTAETLAARVLAVELKLYPQALALVATGRATPASDGTVRTAAAAAPAAQLIVPDADLPR
jgi:phosphoribosylglycinamide formyltransferase-1